MNTDDLPQVLQQASPHTPAPYDGPTREEVLAMRREYLTPGLITYYREPLLVVEGHMQYLWDETGKQYLDAFAGIVTVSVGHCHPKIVEKVRAQIGKLQHVTTIYLHPAQASKCSAVPRQPAPCRTRRPFWRNEPTLKNRAISTPCPHPKKPLPPRPPA